MNELQPVTAGFIPLTDSALLIAARECGFSAREGIDLILAKETSWASIRDHMAVGHYEVAHMLAPMPVAFNLGLTQLSVPVIAPMALGLGGNAVTVGNDVWKAMVEAGATANADPRVNGAALKAVIDKRKAAGERPFSFAVVHPHSGHNFELRYWLAGSGIDPERDVEIVIVPPPLMASALESDQIDGYCVGEPWNSVAVDRGLGAIATVKAAIWRSSPEKVLGVQAEWAAGRPDLLAALLRALFRAARWCGEPANHPSLASMLSRPEYLDLDARLISRALSGNLQLDAGAQAAFADFFIPLERAATFPWKSHALWFYSQMVRWGQIEHSAENARLAEGSYRPDIYREALRPLGAALPSANSKVEGALTTVRGVGATSGRLMLGPDGFFDEKIFDPDLLDEYIATQKN